MPLEDEDLVAGGALLPPDVIAAIADSSGSGSGSGSSGGGGSHRSKPKPPPKKRGAKQTTTTAQKHERQPLSAQDNPQSHAPPTGKRGRVQPKAASSETHPKTASLGQKGHPSPRRFDPSRGRYSPSGHSSSSKGLVGVSVSHGISITRRLPPIETPVGRVRVKVQASATLAVQGRKRDKVRVNLAPLNEGGRVSIKAHDLAVSSSNLYHAAHSLHGKVLEKSSRGPSTIRMLHRFRD